MNDDEIIRLPSQISYSYATIKITQSRIDKGLIAIPISLSSNFPDHNTYVNVILNEKSPELKHYSSNTESAHENRIEGLTGWFRENYIRAGDEVVIQFIDKKKLIYKLIPEKIFLNKTKELQHSFDTSHKEQEAIDNIRKISEWTRLKQESVLLSEFSRLSNDSPTTTRPVVYRSPHNKSEGTPVHLRTLLKNVYQGHCQVCDFWFPKKNTEPYFEIHHIDRTLSHYLKNLLVVCGNCHNQFEYSDAGIHYNDERWLTRVIFNGHEFKVNQAALDIEKKKYFKELYI